MRNRHVLYLLKISNNIVKYAFWLYFLFIIGYYYLYDDVIPIFLGYLFWLLLGIRLGYLIANKAIRYRSKDNI
jgi:hypothetical protein